MIVFVGGGELKKVFLGNTEIKEIRVGDKRVYPNGRLPSQYQEVEYIESNGNQYIHSGYIPNYYSKIYCKFAHNEHVIDTPVFGTRNDNNNHSFVLRSHPSNYSGGTGLSQCLFNSNNKTNLNGYSQGTIIEFQYDRSSGQYGSQTWTWSNSTGSPSYNLIIFGLYNGSYGIDSRKFSGKMYSFKIRDNNNLVRDFVPCYRKSDNVIGLYDIVNNTFYTNSGSGSFTKGPNVN